MATPNKAGYLKPHRAAELLRTALSIVAPLQPALASIQVTGSRVAHAEPALTLFVPQNMIASGQAKMVRDLVDGLAPRGLILHMVSGGSPAQIA